MNLWKRQEWVFRYPVMLASNAQTFSGTANRAPWSRAESLV